MPTENNRVDVPIESIRELPPVHEVVITPEVMDKLKMAIRINEKLALGKFLTPADTSSDEFRREFPEIAGAYALFYSGTDEESIRGTLKVINDSVVLCYGSVFPELTTSLLAKASAVYGNLLRDPERLNATQAINKAHEEGHYYVSVRYEGDIHREYEKFLRALFAKQASLAVEIPSTDVQISEMRINGARIDGLTSANFATLVSEEALAIQNSLRYCLQKTPENLDDMTIFEFSPEAVFLTYTSRFKSDMGFEQIYNAYLNGEDAQLILSGINPHAMAHIILFTKDPEIFDKIRNGDMTRVEFLDACAHGLRDAFDDPREFVESICGASGQGEELPFTVKLDQHSIRTHEKLRALMVN